MVRLLINSNKYCNVETVKLVGEGEYNLNSLKEILVTDSYLGLEQDVIQCQNEEPFDNCTTRQYRNTILGECGCLPLKLRHEVCVCLAIERTYRVIQ